MKAVAKPAAPYFCLASFKISIMQEEFRDIPGYEESYQISDLAIVKSLERKVFRVSDKTKLLYIQKGRLLKQMLNNKGYLTVFLYKEGKQKLFKVSVLIAMAFLGHKPDGTTKIVVDHINEVKTDDRLVNLQLISNRENVTRSIKGGTSIYTGVHWAKREKRWIATIGINGKTKYLGSFNDELKASDAYQRALKELDSN